MASLQDRDPTRPTTKVAGVIVDRRRLTEADHIVDRCRLTEAAHHTGARRRRMVVATPVRQRRRMVVATHVRQHRLMVADLGAGRLLTAAPGRMVDSEGAMHLLTAAADRLADSVVAVAGTLLADLVEAATFQAVAEDIAAVEEAEVTAAAVEVAALMPDIANRKAE